MRNRVLWNVISAFEKGLSVPEWAWRIGVFVFIGTSGTVTALVAKADPVLKALGPIYWIGVGVIVTIVISSILYLVKAFQLKQMEADWYCKLSCVNS